MSRKLPYWAVEFRGCAPYLSDEFFKVQGEALAEEAKRAIDESRVQVELASKPTNETVAQYIGPLTIQPLGSRVFNDQVY
jgi:hypothetical protein